VNLLADFAAWSLPAFALVLLLAQLAAKEVGYAIGRRAAARRRAAGEAGAGEDDGTGLLTSALLGLLAFVLALSLSAAADRFAERRAGALAEANAIGTAWLRTHAVDHPAAAEARRMLEEYIGHRAAFVRAGRADAAAIAEATQRSGELQNAIWARLAALARERPDAVTASLLAAANEAFDAATAERLAFASGLPPTIVATLLALALVGMGAVGFALGRRPAARPNRGLALLLVVAWTAVLVQVLDLGAARVGQLRAGTAAYEWTLEGFRSYPSPPR